MESKQAFYYENGGQIKVRVTSLNFDPKAQSAFVVSGESPLIEA